MVWLMPKQESFVIQGDKRDHDHVVKHGIGGSSAGKKK